MGIGGIFYERLLLKVIHFSSVLALNIPNK
jgi:hypothetical protein